MDGGLSLAQRWSLQLMSWSEKVELELQLSELERVSCRDPTIVAPVRNIVSREPARRARQMLVAPAESAPSGCHWEC